MSPFENLGKNKALISKKMLVFHSIANVLLNENDSISVFSSDDSEGMSWHLWM